MNISFVVPRLGSGEFSCIIHDNLKYLIEEILINVSTVRIY